MMSLLHIGLDAKDLKQALPETTKAIMAILNSSAGDKVKTAAISAIKEQSQITGTTVTNCHFEGK